MKKIFLIILLILITNNFIYSQDFTKLKVELGGIYGLPSDGAYTAGIGYYFNPSYYITDKINVGVKAEFAIIGAASEDGLSVSISAIGSYLATFNYYFTTSKVRPYIGVGAGLYQLGSASVGTDVASIDVEFGDKFGVAPKIGLDLSHFTISVSYNYIIGLDSEFASKNYISLGVGVFFGGGKKGNGNSKTKGGYLDFGIEDEE
ncbi:MAG: hypothetical protein JXR51_16855 [Bacteroidales bacterium]|nr:hypothetical protein [Bacteroidales bacterium]MBN2758839.1 hypothetical protein [Bacteroidales bacterium]